MTQANLPPLRSSPNVLLPARITAVLGPTNTGKTHLAIERLCGHASGMMGLPLRLLAREIYERVVALKGAHSVALITGEEKIIPKLPAYYVCTVEAMPLEKQVDFLAVDEIQLCADAERGHVFTDRLLHARGRYETLFLGATTFAPLFKRLFPEGDIISRERLSKLSYAGSKKLTRLPGRTAIVAFSTQNVYAIAELIRRQRGGAAVVMGSLSPKTRNAQVALFQNREVDFLVATDAIGMGLNMDIDHVAFSALSKFDGRHIRPLNAQEVGQIAGRAGRFTREGTFGVTGDCHEIDEDLVHAVENHQFMALDGAHWRNRELDFSTPQNLLQSLTRPSEHPALRLAKEALDEKSLRHLAQTEDVAAKISNPILLKTLWDVCQLPDFRKIGLDEHIRMVEHLFWSRLSPDGFIADDWFATQISYHDQLDGDIDTLSMRLAGMRSLSYMANRSNWLKRPEHWREVARDLEERLSDMLHTRLMQRFIDQRTSVLLKALNADAVISASVSDDGKVLVAGHEVGHIRGLIFSLTQGDSFIEDRALRSAAHRAITPLLHERLKQLASSASKAFKLKGRHIFWQGHAVAQLTTHDLFAPRIKLMSEIDHPALSALAEKRLNDFVSQLSRHELKAFWKLKQAIEAPDTAPPVRAVAFRLLEQNGFMLRPEDLNLSDEDKAALKTLGIVFNRFVTYMSALKTHQAREKICAFKGIGTKTLLCVTLGEKRLFTSRQADVLDHAFGAAHWVAAKGTLYPKADAFLALNLEPEALEDLLRALGYQKMPPLRIGQDDERVGWRHKSQIREKPARVKQSPPKNTLQGKARKMPKAASKPLEKPYFNPYSPFSVLVQRDS